VAATVPENHVGALSDTIPVLIRMSGPDALCTYVNAGWLAFTGRSLVEELGDGWAEGVFPEDHERCLTTSRDAVARRVPLEMEYRLRRADGTFRWLLDRGAPVYGSDGALSEYVSSCRPPGEKPGPGPPSRSTSDASCWSTREVVGWRWRHPSASTTTPGTGASASLSARASPGEWRRCGRP
jgi:PAS domain S-box-containing protein